MTANEARLVIEAALVTVAFIGLVALASWYVVQSRRRNPIVVAAAVAELSAANDELARQIRSLQRDQMVVHTELIRLQTRLEIQTAYSRALADYSRSQAAYSEMLADRLRALGQDVPPGPGNPPMPPMIDISPPPAANDETIGLSLPVILAALFNDEELDDLAVRVGALPEDLKGETISRRAVSLVLWARRRGRLDRLVAVARQLRPDGGI